MIDAAFVRAIAELQAQAMQANIAFNERFVDEALVRYPDGKCEWKKLQPPRVAHKFDSLPDFAAYLASFPSAEVFVSQTEAVACLDRASRRETVALRLVRSPEWTLLTARAVAGNWMMIPDAISLLRFGIGASSSVDTAEGFDDHADVDEVLSALRATQFSNANTARASIDPGRESMGRSVERTVRSETGGPIPVSFTACVPVFSVEGISITEAVCLGVAFDIERGFVSFPPIGGSIQAAEVRALGKVRDFLQARLSGLKVSRGAFAVSGG